MTLFPSASASSSASAHRGIGLSNSLHSEVAPCLPLPSLPVFFGASYPLLRLFDEPDGSYATSGTHHLAQSNNIADLLRATDVSYLW
ncbi:sister chromatid cohesion protein SCC2-like [Cucurbita moschata]|uniref:Sister chromatid cohesion protein SCC2-like n=1 Tax=Cucurbita moschata TaxID=3662 RepID=A0A6J1EX99_CUCMO|nr:sister chromatid cohesion protein SCC2-like [Cucurbita moschata]